MSDMVNETKEKTGAEKPMREISVRAVTLSVKGVISCFPTGRFCL